MLLCSVLKIPTWLHSSRGMLGDVLCADPVALPCQIAGRTTSHELRTTSPELQRHPLAQKEKSRGCLPTRKHPDEAVAGSGASFRGRSGPSFKGNPLEIEQENETVKEVRLALEGAAAHVERRASCCEKDSLNLWQGLISPASCIALPVLPLSWRTVFAGTRLMGTLLHSHEATACQQSMPAKPCGKTLGRTAPAGMQVEAIAWRVKKSLLLHWLTCGIYSTRQSGGTQGFWKGVRENFASFVGYPEPESSPNLGEPPPAFTTPPCSRWRSMDSELKATRSRHTLPVLPRSPSHAEGPWYMVWVKGQGAILCQQPVCGG